VTSFDENIKFYFNVEKFAYLEPGFGSAFVKKAGSESEYNECGSGTLGKAVQKV
jgi:hypothetical protein